MFGGNQEFSGVLASVAQKSGASGAASRLPESETSPDETSVIAASSSGAVPPVLPAESGRASRTAASAVLVRPPPSSRPPVPTEPPPPVVRPPPPSPPVALASYQMSGTLLVSLESSTQATPRASPQQTANVKRPRLVMPRERRSYTFPSRSGWSGSPATPRSRPTLRPRTPVSPAPRARSAPCRGCRVGAGAPGSRRSGPEWTRARQ